MKYEVMINPGGFVQLLIADENDVYQVMAEFKRACFNGSQDTTVAAAMKVREFLNRNHAEMVREEREVQG